MRFLLLLTLFTGATAVIRATLPQAVPDVTYTLPSNVITVNSNDNLQDIINSAPLGSVLQLPAGAVFQLTSPLNLPKKNGTGWIYVQTAGFHQQVAPGTRVSPSDASKMAELRVSNSQGAITCDKGAHHFRFVGLNINSPSLVNNLILFMDLYTQTMDELTSDFIIDRCYVHASSSAGTRRGVALNSKNSAVIDSHFEGFGEAGADSQAISGWMGPGPFLIENNFLEGAAENVIFGGGDPPAALAEYQIIPSDITFRRNHLKKRMEWFGGSFVVKNLFELKSARRVLVDGNVMENNWLNGQVGVAVVFTTRNQEGTCPWCVVQDVTFTNNIVANSCSGVTILNYDNYHPSGNTSRITLENNLFFNLTKVLCDAADTRQFNLFNGGGLGKDYLITKNTVISTNEPITFVTMGDSPVVVDNFEFSYNVLEHGSYGWAGSINTYATNGREFGNLIIKDLVEFNTNNFPEDTFADTYETAGFIDASNRDYRRNVTCDTCPGADVEQILCHVRHADNLPGSLGVLKQLLGQLNCPGQGTSATVATSMQGTSTNSTDDTISASMSTAVTLGLVLALLAILSI